MTSFNSPANDNTATRKSFAQRFAIPQGIGMPARIFAASLALGVVLAVPSSLIDNINHTALIIACYAIFLFAVVAIQRDARSRATKNTLGKPMQLATSSGFSVLRKPIYLIFLVPLTSIALLSIPAAIVAIVVFVCAAHATTTDRSHTSTLGQDFTAFTKTTRRWL